MIIGKEGIRCAIVLLVLVAVIGCAQALPDLVVTSVTPNCGELFGNESNVIEAEIQNIGDMAAKASHASFVLSDGYSENVAVLPLDAGNSTTVSITDPTTRSAGAAVNITVTADCNGEIDESNLTNNVTVQAETVVNNGYKGKRYTGGSDITTWQIFELKGDLLYSTGDSYYLSVSYYPDWTHYTVNWTASDLPVPGTATVKEARLYVPYTWAKNNVMPGYMNLTFNGNLQTLDYHYWDEKGYGSSYPYGTLVYNVTTDFSTSGNLADLVNSYSDGGQVSMRGMVLVVIYGDENEPLKKILVNEEFDLLYGGSNYCTTAEEATAYAQFGSIDLSTIGSVKLITVAPGAGPNEGELLFNGQTWTNVWNYAGGTQIGIDERDVTAYLATTNEAGFQSSGDWMEASNAILVVEYEPDLIATAITPNCGGYIFANESNEIQAVIENVGDADAGAFNVTVAVDGYSGRVTVQSLAAGNSTTISITDPTIRTAGTVVTITVTADVDNEINESDETNNTLEIEKTVVNNGYKGKRYTGGSDITTWQIFDLQGDLLYSVGDSQYLSGSSTPWTTYTANWTAGNLPVPGTATVKEARLYVPYTWAKNNVMPGYMNLTFNGNLQTLDYHYWDEKGFGTSNPYGMLVYTVTEDFSTSGNFADLVNSYPGGGQVSLRGMVLVVIYEDENEPLRKILVNEEFDLLYGGSSQCTTAEEATAYAPFGSIDLSTIGSAKLITVAPGADPNEGELIFNGQTWTDVWSDNGVTQIGIDERDVTAYLATTNEAGFQSSGDWMEASNAILVVEYEPSTPPARHGGTPRDSDGDGYSDIEELLQGTDSSDPNDYPGKAAKTPTIPSPAPTTLATPLPTMTATPLPIPVATPTSTPASTPTPTEPGFGVVFAIGGLVALAYLMRRTRWKK
jgi:hypothetical protein